MQTQAIEIEETAGEELELVDAKNARRQSDPNKEALSFWVTDYA